MLQVAGTASTTGDIGLDVSTTGSYVQLADLLPKFAMPHLPGSLSPGVDNRNKSMSVTTQAVSFLLTIVLQFDDWTGTISVDNSDTAIDIKATGTIKIGSTNGFSATITTETDPVNKDIIIEVTHDGDLQPFDRLPGFTSPPFEGAPYSLIRWKLLF